MLFLCSIAVQTISDMSVSDNSKAPALIIVDSVQTMRSGSSASAAGSVAQIRDSTAQLVQLAKLTGMFFDLSFLLFKKTEIIVSSGDVCAGQQGVRCLSQDMSLSQAKWQDRESLSTWLTQVCFYTHAHIHRFAKLTTVIFLCVINSVVYGRQRTVRAPPFAQCEESLRLYLGGGCVRHDRGRVGRCAQPLRDISISRQRRSWRGRGGCLCSSANGRVQVKEVLV